MYVFLCAICICGLYNLKRDDMNPMYSCRNADFPVGFFFADEDVLLLVKLAMFKATVCVSGTRATKRHVV